MPTTEMILDTRMGLTSVDDKQSYKKDPKKVLKFTREYTRDDRTLKMELKIEGKEEEIEEYFPDYTTGRTIYIEVSHGGETTIDDFQEEDAEVIG